MPALLRGVIRQYLRLTRYAADAGSSSGDVRTILKSKAQFLSPSVMPSKNGRVN
jgi:hypothetical protein